MSVQSPATEFTLPGVVDGSVERVDVGSWFGETVVLLAFYPSNFGPEAGQSAALVRAVEDLASEADAKAIGVAPESVYSHRQFAKEAAIDSPLVSDRDGAVATEYGVGRTGDAGQPLAERSLFVVDYRGAIVHEWTASQAATMPDFEELRSLLGELTPDRSARGSYRVGHARYTEGRRHLSAGFEHCENGNWGLAGSAFTDACSEFGEASDAFLTGQRLADDEALGAHSSRGRVAASKYWEAAEWLAGFATAARKDDEAARKEHRGAAEQALQEISDVTVPAPDDLDESVPDSDELPA